MSEFRFPRPKTDSLNEVVFTAPRQGCCQSGSESLADQRSPGMLPFSGTKLFGEFTCDSATRSEASPGYAFIRNEMIGPNKFVSVLYQGWVFFPAVQAKAVPGPIVIICHGAVVGGAPPGYFKKAYLYMMRCLASNGMVVLSIDSETTAKDKGENNTPGLRADKILTHLKNIVKEMKAQKGIDLKGQPLILMGHSQGGEAVAIVADAVRKGLAPDFTTVKAVIALAPRFTPTQFTYAKRFADSLLVMHGSIDLDQAQGQGISLYEFADQMVYKGLIWIFGGTHAGFVDATLPVTFNSTDGGANVIDIADVPKRISPASQNWMALVYILEFLRWRLGKQGGNSLIVRGYLLPSIANSPPIPEGKSAPRLQPPLFSDLDAKEVEFSSVATVSGFTEALGPTGDISMLCSTSFNKDSGYRLKWELGKNGTPTIRFNYSGPGLGQFLSKSLLVNMVRVVDSDLNVMAEAVSVKVSLGAKGFPSSGTFSVKIPDSQELVTEFTNTDIRISKTVMCTLNVVLDAIPGVSALFLENLTSATFSFAGTSKTGDILIGTPRISVA